MVQNKHMPWISILVSLSLSLSPIVELRRTSTTIAMSFIFLRSCFMGFIFFFWCGFGCGFIWFLWFWLWVHLISFVFASISVLAFASVSASISTDWTRFRKRADGGLERMELDLGLRLGQNGAWSQIDHYLCFMGFLFFFSFFCFWVVGLIMIWLWWGYGLWLMVVVDCGRGGGGAELWVLIVVVVEWVATLLGFHFFFASWLCVLFDFDLLVVWKMRGIFGLDS